MGFLVFDIDVSIVVNDVVRTVFYKFYLVVMIERYVSENRGKIIIFLVNVFFRECIYGGNVFVSGLNENVCDF